MKTLTKLFALTLTLCVALSIISVPTGVNAAENLFNNISSNNFGMYAVPIKGEVNIDAYLDDWDWSGRIMIFPDYDSIATKSAEVAAMYDAENLYLGFKVKDATPLLNTRDPYLEYSSTWRGDCFQLRAVTDHCVWLTTAYHVNTDQYSMYVDEFTGMTTKTDSGRQVMYLSEPGSTKMTVIHDVGTVPADRYVEGMEICAREDTQNAGTYYFEIKMPFETIWNDPGKYPKAGSVCQLAFEVYWSNDTGYNTDSDYKDNLQAGTTSRSFFYNKESIWGNLTFIAENDIEVRQYSKDKKLPMNGYLEIPVEVPKDKDTITVVIENSKGKRIRNLIAELDYKDFEEYYVSETETTRTVKLLWDGRDDYGMKVSPGEYTFKTVAYNPVDPVFDTVYYGPGQIPWSKSSNASSGWLADHTPPRSVATYGDEVYVGAAFAEGGHGLMALNSGDGTKKWGTTLGAHLLEANSKYIYAIPGWDWTQDMTINLNQILLRYDRLTGKYNPFVIDGVQQPLQMYMSDILGVKNGESVPNVVGLAVSEEYIALSIENLTGVAGMDIKWHGTSLRYPDAVQIYNAEDLTPIKRIPLPDVAAMEFSKDGKHLYAIVGKNEVVEINIISGRVTTLKLKDVDSSVKFSCITTDNDGNIVLFDMGDDCQIKAYNPTTGKLLYTAAKLGGRTYDGEWEEQGLTRETSDLAVDNNGDIWVTEDWNYPRRISKWSPADGKLVDDYIGATFYMGGNSGVSQYDPDLVYWGPVEMRLNREDDSYEVERILYIPDPLKGEMFPMDGGGNSAIQQFKSNASGVEKKYTFADGVLYIETESGRYRPCFAIGSGIPSFASYNKTPQYSVLNTAKYAAACGGAWAKSPARDNGDHSWMWNDYNMDGLTQAEEITWFEGTYYDTLRDVRSFLPTRFNWSAYMTDSLSFSAYNSAGNYYYGSALLGIYSPEGFSEDGAPFYSVDNLKIVEDKVHANQASEHYYFEDEGTAIIIPATSSSPDKSKIAIKCYDVESGEILWTYRNDYAGVAGSHSSPMQPDNGVVIGSLKLMGVYHNSQGDKFFHIRGNVGADYIMTSDGYFVGTMFADNRLGGEALPDTVAEAKGKSMIGVSTGGEPFGGNGATHSDGVSRFILTTGGRCAIVCRLENLDSFERLAPVKFTVTQEELDKAYAYVSETITDESQFGTEQTDTSYQIMKATSGFTIDGELSDWDGFSELLVEAEGVHERSTVKVAWNEENLFVSFNTRDESPMANSGVDFQRLFKTGDVADINLSPTGNKNDDAADGDMRITFSVYGGNMVAVLSKPVDSKAKDGEGFSYSSPVTTTPFDKVVLLPEAEIGIKRNDEGYTLEARIPLSALGITVDTSKQITGDVGIIKSDDAGAQNLARIYYFNKETGLISDLPGEARLWPSRWGAMRFSKTDPRIEAGIE